MLAVIVSLPMLLLLPLLLRVRTQRIAVLVAVVELRPLLAVICKTAFPFRLFGRCRALAPPPAGWVAAATAGAAGGGALARPGSSQQQETAGTLVFFFHPGACQVGRQQTAAAMLQACAALRPARLSAACLLGLLDWC